MEMTQKQIEIEAQNYLNGLDLPENADKQLILENFKNGMSWMLMYAKDEKQKLTDKAVEWFSYRFPNISKEALEKFKEDMKGE